MVSNKEFLQTAAVVGLTYLGMFGILKFFTSKTSDIEVTEEPWDPNPGVDKNAEGFGCGCSNMDCNCAESDTTQATVLPWDEMRIPYSGLVARNMTVRERSNSQMLELFGGVPPVNVTDMTSLITGGRL